jgi:hypothetical protein
VSPEVYPMTATRDALWNIRNSVGRIRSLPLRRLAELEQTENRLALAARNDGLRLAPTCVLTRQIVRPKWLDMAWPAL